MTKINKDSLPKKGLLTKDELRRINLKTLKYPLAVAEKDYFLTLVSKIIYDSPLRNKLVFKGGTAIYHTWLEQYRFSEDLDFTSLDPNINSDEVKNILEAPDFLSVKKDYTSKATIKIEKLQYQGSLGLPNCLKVEIDFMQNVVLPAKSLKYKNVWGVKTKVNAMDIREICAEKIRASSDRARYRDFYDLFMILQNFDLDLSEVIDLIKQKEIRKPIIQESILKNLAFALEHKEHEMQEIYYFRAVEDAAILEMADKLRL